MSTTTIDHHPTPPRRSQPLEALHLANGIRTYRSQLKRRVRENWQEAARVLAGRDPRLANMAVYDLLMAVPKHGTGKVHRMLAVEHISPSKTLGGLTVRQRSALVLALARSHGGRVPLGAAVEPEKPEGLRRG